MACYNNECCAYDSLGNPYMYRCHDLSWTKVRKLASFDNIQFKYNASGIRYQKYNEITEKTTNYTLDGDRILKETDGTNTITYYYANGNAPIGFNYNGTDYYFCKNIQGDVVGIYNASGHIVVKYVYDAWGNHKIYDANNNEVTSTSHIGYINPIRYRGYYFDVETGLYYLGARYYDPETGRFLNSDAIEYLAPEQLGGLNLYAYCGNNPVIAMDPTGSSWNSFWKGVGDWLGDNWDIVFGVGLLVTSVAISVVTLGTGTVVIAGVVAGAVVGGTFGAINAIATGDNVIKGALTNALVGAAGGINPAAAFCAASGISLLNDGVADEKLDWKESLIKAGTTGFTASIFSKAGNSFTDLMLGETADKIVTAFSASMSAFAFSAYNFIADLLINAFAQE